MTSSTAAGKMVEHERVRQAERHAKMQAKDGTLAGDVGTVGAATQAKKNCGKGAAGQKCDRVRARLEHASEEGQEQHER